MNLTSVRLLRLLAPMAVTAACQSSAPETAPTPARTPARAPTPSRNSEPQYAVPTRSGPECDSTVVRALSAPDVQPPRPDSLFLPPLPIPRSVAGRAATIRFLVDVQGRAVADSLQILGLEHRDYEARLRDGLRRLRFRPAVLDGCAVPGRYTITLRL